MSHNPANKEINLVNKWILNELSLLQKDYFYHLQKERWEINLITTKLIKFGREKLSQNYLELIKISPWDTNTKKTLLFVYQQLLIMLHPAIPFITDYIYQQITQERILKSPIEAISVEDKKQELWQIDCCLLLISTIRHFRQKNNNINKFYLELAPEWEKKNFLLDFNYFLLPLTSSKILKVKNNFNSFIALPPFGTLWYSEITNKKELEKQLKFYEEECQRSQELLKNVSFLSKAPKSLVREEKKKLIYYREQKEKIENQIIKIR